MDKAKKAAKNESTKRILKLMNELVYGGNEQIVAGMNCTAMNETGMEQERNDQRIA